MSTSTEPAQERTPTAAPDDPQRRFALAATGVVAGGGLLLAAYPFVVSLGPSAKALAEGGPIEAYTSTLAAGELRTVAWRGRPVWIMRRTADMVRALQASDPVLADPLSQRSHQPASCVNATRSVRPEIFVAIGVCTHLGCIPRLRLDDAALNAELSAPGGFLCPCHGSRFDLAGRVVRNVPAPTNLDIPEYRFISASALRIG